MTAAKPERALRAGPIAAGWKVQSVGAGSGIAQKRVERIGAVFAIQVGLRLGRGCDEETLKLEWCDEHTVNELRQQKTCL